MRTTVTIDKKLLDEAERLTGLTDRDALVNEGMRALIARESARRLARLGGSDSHARIAPRRRSAAP
ncbi:MAG TPA: type II toxin-antitoxin system VapB family antitoxin [Gammaproteobacteria bacterium]|nr:type II toxin-antitoxin system VapB family antitoxin [Gammaproteobacteria bacterium]